MRDTDDAHNMIAESIRFAANVLGTGNAATPMGALELLAKETKEGNERIAESLFAMATALDDIATAIRESRGSGGKQ
jgi:spore maturation protein SpmA